MYLALLKVRQLGATAISEIFTRPQHFGFQAIPTFLLCIQHSFLYFSIFTSPQLLGFEKSETDVAQCMRGWDGIGMGLVG